MTTVKYHTTWYVYTYIKGCVSGDVEAIMPQRPDTLIHIVALPLVLTFGFLGLLDGIELTADVLQPPFKLASLFQSQLLPRLPTAGLDHCADTRTRGQAF